MSDVAFNPALLGYWKYTDTKKEKFMEFSRIPTERKKELTPDIAKISEKGYLVSNMDSAGNVMSQSFVFLAKIGKNYYLDYYPAEMPSQTQLLFREQHQEWQLQASYSLEVLR